MIAIEYLKEIPRAWIPRRPSNSWLYRWLKNGSVLINGKRVKPSEKVKTPIRQLIFFRGINRVTILDDGRYKMSWRKRGR